RPPPGERGASGTGTGSTGAGRESPICGRRAASCGGAARRGSAGGASCEELVSAGRPGDAFPVMASPGALRPVVGSDIKWVPS
ncbi:MAG: hypothetical protein ACRDZ6_05365, partial [Acidimicrobiales bacterium]